MFLYEIQKFLDPLLTWHAQNGESIQLLRNSKAVVSAMFNTNDRLYVASSDKTLRVWKTHIECSQKFDGHVDKVLSFTIVNDTM